MESKPLPWAVPEKLDHRESVQLFPSSGRSWGLAFFACFLCVNPGRGATTTSCMLDQTIIFLTGPQITRICQVSLTLQDNRNRSQSFGQPPERLGLWMYGTTLCYSRKKRRALFFLIHLICANLVGVAIFSVSPKFHLCSY